MEQNLEQQQEVMHLEQCLSIIRENIKGYEEKEEAYRKEVTELFTAVRQGDGDSYGQLMAGQNILEHTRNSLRKNRAALKKAYFGRVDYFDKSYGLKECCYIGKNGITRNQTEVVIVDWRAPAASIYYENELGEGSYDVPGSAPVSIDLEKKRTYDIEEDRLLGFYDDDVAANDELLVKYLSQNKEAVLGDIIATIQKEQNQIIRDIPYKNMIVQGVAGSGKTTVALHRISYILYNYEKQFKPSEFCIVASSDMLLNYISSGLPELDVSHVKQMRMDVFIPYLLDKSWKKKYRLVPDGKDAPVRSKLPFVRKLDAFLEEFTDACLALADIKDPVLGLILSKENMEGTRKDNPGLSLLMFEKLLNERIIARIRFLCTDREKSLLVNKKGEYKKYFDSQRHKWTEPEIYLKFLYRLKQTDSFEGLEDTIQRVEQDEFDLYDTAALALIRKRVLQKKEADEFSQIIVDEAQDFGEMIYYVLHQVLPDCYFTIMGDVSQNIRYETGMNDWEGVKKALLAPERDSFYLLSKSYRNTIEISECAGKILEKASYGAYRIEPVIRHGRPVQTVRRKEEELAGELKRLLARLNGEGFETIAVVCRDETEAKEVKQYLKEERDSKDKQEENFHNGVMVLPVTLTKGLEFDVVILWKPDEKHYGMNRKEAKLLYVAVTRALHELYLLGDEDLSPLF